MVEIKEEHVGKVFTKDELGFNTFSDIPKTFRVLSVFRRRCSDYKVIWLYCNENGRTFNIKLKRKPVIYNRHNRFNLVEEETDDN